MSGGMRANNQQAGGTDSSTARERAARILLTLRRLGPVQTPDRALPFGWRQAGGARHLRPLLRPAVAADDDPCCRRFRQPRSAR